MNIDQIDVGGIPVDIIFKNIKNIHLSVHPPTGRVRISAPQHLKLETLRVYAISKLDWIKKQQTRLQGQARETRREYLDLESHFVWGRRYLLAVNELRETPSVQLRHKELVLTVRPGSDEQKRAEVLAAWYREELRQAMTPMFEKWQAQLGVQANQVIVRRMKTKWGSCNPHTGNIHLNSELAKKLPECLEYIIVHELTHLLEPTHNERFVALMDQSMPNWRHRREELNRAPLGHVEWDY